MAFAEPGKVGDRGKFASLVVQLPWGIRQGCEVHTVVVMVVIVAAQEKGVDIFGRMRLAAERWSDGDFWAKFVKLYSESLHPAAQPTQEAANIGLGGEMRSTQ